MAVKVLVSPIGKNDPDPSAGLFTWKEQLSEKTGSTKGYNGSAVSWVIIDLNA